MLYCAPRDHMVRRYDGSFVGRFVERRCALRTGWECDAAVEDLRQTTAAEHQQEAAGGERRAA